MNNRNIIVNLIFIFILSMFFSPIHGSEIPKVLLHVTSNSQTIHQNALNNADALLKKYGKGNIIVEIVANSGGVGIANVNNRINGKVASLLGQGVRLSVCSTTLTKMKNSGTLIPLIEGTNHVPNGTIRVVELQQQGYLYIRP